MKKRLLLTLALLINISLVNTSETKYAILKKISTSSVRNSFLVANLALLGTIGANAVFLKDSPYGYPLILITLPSIAFVFKGALFDTSLRTISPFYDKPIIEQPILLVKYSLIK